MNHFYANQYNIQATEKGDHVNANHLYDTAGADDKENDLQCKPFTEFIIWRVNQINVVSDWRVLLSYLALISYEYCTNHVYILYVIYGSCSNKRLYE